IADVDCNYLNDQCNDGVCLNHQCVQQPKQLSTPCDDGLWCSEEDHCDGSGNCVQETARNCDDQDVCTIDTCSEENDQCVHTFSDTEGPNTHDVIVDPYYNNGQFDVDAVTEDECSNIQTAEYFLGHATVGYCGDPGTGTIMDPTDGSFDEKIEEIKKDNIEYYRDGLNWICIQAKDTQEIWGNCACAYFETDTIPPDCPYDMYLDDELYPDEYLICGDNAWLNATVCDQQSWIQGGEYFIDLQIPPIPAPWSGYWMNTLYNFTRNDGWHCSVIGAFVDASGLEDGTHYIKLRGKDTVENWGKIAQCLGVSFIRDTTAPVTLKEIIPADGAKVDCYNDEETEANVAEKAPQGTTNGCYYVKQGTQIHLTSYDPDPQQTGEFAGDVIIHWRVWYKLNPGDPWVLDQQGQSDPDGEVWITLSKDSYHLIEYWAVDLCGWEEEHHFELDIVDTVPPVGSKLVGEPKLPGDGTFDWWVRDHVTPITLDCVDPEPHPADHEIMCYRISFDEEPPFLTREYCAEFGGQYSGGEGIEGWCCVEKEGLPYTFTFQEDSLHDLEYFCEDALGNENEVDIEWFRVDSTPPVTTKTYGEPRYPDDPYHPMWITSSTPVTLTAVDYEEPCAVGVDKTYWRNKVVDNACCYTGNIMSYWNFYEETPTGYGQYVTGPDTPPMGVGSANLVTQAGGGVALIKYDYAGFMLSNIYTLMYSTYQSPSSSATPSQQVALQFNIDFDCTDGDTSWQGRLIFEPYWNTEQGTPAKGVWQTWNARAGKWWSSNGNIPQGSPMYFDDILTKYPNVCIHPIYGGLLVKAGSGWPDFDGNADMVVFNDDVYDFEPEEEWNVYDGEFTKPEESCHLIEYYSVDRLGNEETIKRQCIFVDNTPPNIYKRVSQPVHDCTPEEAAQYGDPDYGCHYITSQTTIALNCIDDQQLHPVDDVTLYWRNYLIGETPLAYNVVPGGYYEIQKTPDSEHVLEFYCEDALGNNQGTAENPHVEIDIVDTKPPVSQKDLGEPKHECTEDEAMMYYGTPIPTDGCYFINQSTPITLTCTDQDPHPVDHVKIYYRDYLVGENPPVFTEVDGDFVTFPKDRDSAHILEWYCVDELGNTEATHMEYDIVDTEPPETSKEIIGPQYYDEVKDKFYIDGVTEIELTCIDPDPHPVDHEVIYYRYRVDDGNWPEEFTEYTGKFTFPEESKHDLEYYCIDALGNEEVHQFEIDY
ncbi:MAG: hypothetical protein KAU24_00345, partial [Candidatus Aenigmarchaeota archaeon]|nr:hypothetical protein [Candidatus Aenigmarchaeota archaeon]